MVITRILVILFFFSSSFFAQEKYLIYFKDKGAKTNFVLSKKTALDQAAASSLSQRSIERRKKAKGNNYFTFEDLPIEQTYLNIIII